MNIENNVMHDVTSLMTFPILHQGNEFMWTNGKVVAQKHWAPGEPNNHNKADENCVEVNNPWKPRGSWNDQTCSDKNGFVCEKGM